MKIGILALQGCVHQHVEHLEALGVEAFAVKTQEEISRCDAFILPGGESTTMLKLLNNFKLLEFCREEFQKKPTWGICAGSILLAKKVKTLPTPGFSLMGLEILRNAYGAQQESFETKINDYQVFFIRAPKIIAGEKNVKILAQDQEDILWAVENHWMVTTFHPELNPLKPSPFHQYFLKEVVRPFYNDGR